MLRRKLFAQAIGDEVLLRHQAQVLIADQNTPLDGTELEKISRKHGLDMAACCYYQSLLNSEHGRFKAKIDQISYVNNFTHNHTSKNIKILLVPGMFYKEKPEVGADGALVISIARRCGFEAEIIPVLSKGSMLANVEIIDAWLQRESATAIWLVSLSKGSSEVRYYLQNNSISASIKGWINIAGIHQGSPHAKRKRSTRSRRLVYKAFCKMINVDYQVLAELDSDNDIWKNSYWDQSLEYLHLVPIPLRSHLLPLVINRYKKLLNHCYQPNDGIVPVADVNVLPGKVYPLWGVDHFVRTPLISELLYKFFSYITQSEHNINIMEEANESDY